MKKKKYITPRMELITLDNEISLQLESNPPAGPGEVTNQFPTTSNNHPFKDGIS